MSGESSDSVRPAYRYFELISGMGRTVGIFRFPANGKSPSEQKQSDVERFMEDGTWLSHQRELLRVGRMGGRFDEKDDELTLEQARRLMDKFKRKS